jgi:copper chaperone CopZ
MAVIGKAINKKTLLLYLCSIIGSAFFFGWITNQFLPREWFIFAIDHLGHGHELLPFWVKVISATTLAILILFGCIRKYYNQSKNNLNIPDMSDQISSVKISVTGMTCNHCKMSAEKSISSLQGVVEVIADPGKSEIFIKGKIINLDEVQKKVEDVGFSFHGKI